MSDFNCRLRCGCKIYRSHKIIEISYMPTIDLFIAFWSPRISRFVTKDEAHSLIDYFSLHYHPVKNSDWGHYKTIPYSK